MERRNFLIGIGATSVGGAAVLGSGAFSRVESDRYMTIEVAADPDAYLGLDACDSPHGEEFVDIDDSGHLYVDIGENGNGGEGVNSNSRTWFDDLVQLCNQGTDDACVWIDRGDDWPEVEEGPDAGEPRVDFYLGEDGEESILGEENAVEIGIGECECIGIRTNTHGIDATAEETLLEEVDDVVTLVADVECPDAGPQPGQAFFEVSDLDPMAVTVEPGETFDVSATITNTGDETGTQDVDLFVDGENVASQEVALDGDQSETVTFEDVSTDGLADGEYAITVASEDDQASGTLTVGEPDEVNLLVISITTGWTHRNIPYGIETLQNLEDEIAEGIGVSSVNVDTIPEDPPENYHEDPLTDAPDSFSNADFWMQYDAVIWFNTTGNVLAETEEREAFEQYMANGGGYVGIHSAADTHRGAQADDEWPFYIDMLGGATFVSHPSNQDAEIHVSDRVHPSTDHLPARWEAYDEWYNYAENPRGDVHVLATLDESTYDLGETGGMGADHPIAWAQEYAGGRAWYTGRGHTEGAWDEEHFVDHVIGGIGWATGDLEGDATGTVWDTYEKTEIETDIGEPMKIDTTPDGRVLYTERVTGEVRLYDPGSGEMSTALALDVYTGDEDGMQGIAVDPDFEENGWVYVYYSPAEDDLDPEDDMPYNLLSRFEMDGDTIDPDSETEIIRVHVQRETCCHVGGDIVFGPDGEELYLSTGDDTNPFDSDGYTPIDERDGRESWDAQRSSANTNDLRGSILRIIPNDDGGYAVPDGNLFTGPEYADARDDGLVREEIYVMGCRNPFTLWVDDETGLLYYADYGPDANSWDPERGPNGIVEFNVVSEPGFHGWPYFAGSNIPYVDGEFVDADNDAGYVFESSGEPFDPANPINDSPNNTGLEELPPAQGATIFYPKNWIDLIDNAPAYAEEYVPDEIPWPELGEGGSPMSGPVYRSGEDFDDIALPAYFNGKWFIMEWFGSWLKYVSFDEDGNVLDIEPFLPDHQYNRPQDMTVGVDGELYLLEYGNCYFGCPDSGLFVIEQTGDGTGTEPDPVSIPYGIDSGGENHDQAVSVDGLELDKLPNDAVTQTGEHNVASLLDDDTEYSIDGTDTELLYKTEHYGTDIGYDIEVPNGTYDVTLHFAEIWWGVEGRGGTDSGEGDRVFDVSVQGEEVLSDYDIYAEADGSLAAITETIEDVEVTDGTLSISSNTHEDGDNTKFSGIEIREADDDGGDGDLEYTVANTGGGVADEPAFSMSPSTDDMFDDIDGDGDPSDDDDLSADVYLGYDADNLYLTVEVTDDVHESIAGADMWQADSIQWAVGSGDTYGPEYGLSHVDGSTEIHQWIPGEEQVGTEAIDATTSRSDSTTTYEATVPWNALFDESKGPGDSFPFSVLVNETDDDTRDGVLEWALPAISVDKTVASLGTLTLADDEDPLQEGLEAHIPLDGDAPTNTVTGNDLTVQGGVSTGQDGLIDDAIEVHANQNTDGELSGTAEAGDHVITEPLPLNGDGATAGAWINYTAFEQWARAPYQVGGAPNGTLPAGWDLEFDNTDQAVIPQIWDADSPSRGAGGDAIAVDPETWYFVVTVVSGDDVRLHVFDEDGELDASPQSWTGSRTQSDAEPLILGVGDGRDMEGLVDDVWAYSRALSEGEVADLYEQSLAGAGDGEPAEETVQVVTDGELGDVLADADGNVLYMFDNDTQGAGESSCTDDCTDDWPPLTVDDDPVAGDGVNADLTTFERADGSTQVAANGWPLYYFDGDEAPGDTNGQGVGDIWWVLDPDGEPIRDDGTPDGAIEPGTTITLDAPNAQEWIGISPSSIQGTSNPTLTLVEGEDYTLEWENSSEIGHTLEVQAEDGTELIDNPQTTEPYSFTFTVTQEMAEYFCQPHYSLGMWGPIEVVSN